MCQSENLPEASIRKFTGFHNPEYKKKCTVYIGIVLSLRNLVGVQEEKCRGTGRICLLLDDDKLLLFGPKPLFFLHCKLHGPSVFGPVHFTFYTYVKTPYIRVQNTSTNSLIFFSSSLVFHHGASL